MSCFYFKFCAVFCPTCPTNFVLLNIFKEANKCLELNATTATELRGIMVNIEEKLGQRLADQFYGSNATKLLKSNEVNFSDRQKFTQEVDHFFQRCLSSNISLSLPRSSIDDLVFSVFPSNFVKLSYKISLIKNRFVTLFFIRFS